MPLHREPDRPGPGWLTRAELAEVFGVTETQIDRRHRRFVPPGAEKFAGGKVFVHCRSLLEEMVGAGALPGLEQRR